MEKQNIIKLLFIFFSLLVTIKSDNSQQIKSLSLNLPAKGTLNDNTYHFYQLKLGHISQNDQKNLILRVDEDKSSQDKDNNQYYFSDPDLYVSQDNKYPKDIETSTWYCNELGNDIVAISKDYIYSNSTFYISVYCKKKCNYILNGYLDVTYKLQPFTIYGFRIQRRNSMIYEFKTREKDFEHLSVQLMGVTNAQYSVFINKENPSSSKSYVLEPAWSNGYSYDLYKDSDEYCTSCVFYILIKALEQDAIFRILYTYRDNALSIKPTASLFDTIKGQKNRCYNYPTHNFPQKDSLIMNFFLYGGSMIAKIFGFDEITNKTYTEILNSENTYEIIGDRVIILSNEQIEEFKNKSISKNYNYFHFCLYSKQKSSYLLGLHFSSATQSMQGLNFLNIGQSIKDYLPMNQITKYKLIDLSYESNIKVSLEVLQGKPELYFMYQTYSFLINNNILQQYKHMGYLLESKKNGDKQTIFAPNENNICHQKSKLVNAKEINKYPCVSSIIIKCTVDNVNNTNDIKNDCIFKLTTIADRSKQPIKQKTTYKGLLSKDDYTDFLFNIDDDSVIKFTIILNTVSGELKLSLYKIDEGEENKVFIAENSRNDFLPKVINVQKTDEIKGKNNLKGKYMIRVNSNTFSLYALYFYTIDNNQNQQDNNQIDLYSINLNLINGQMIQDFFDNNIYKLYNYEIYESNFKDIRITVTQRNLELNMFIYDNVNKIEYEFIDRKDNYVKDIDFDKIINFKNYLWTNLYGAKQIIIPYNELIQKVTRDKTLLFIVLAKKYYSSENKNEISFLNQNTFYLGITNNIVPLNLYENIPHQMTLNKNNHFSEQKYLFVHSDNTKKLSFALNVIAGAVDFQIEIKKNRIIFYKNDFINRNEFISISPQNLNKYCQNTGCELILTISQISNESPTYMIFAHSNEERPFQIIPGVLMQNQIQAGENHFYILDFNPRDYEDENKLGNILMRFRGGQADLYMKFYKYDIEPEIENFPSESDYDYIGESTYSGKILHLDRSLYEECMVTYSSNNEKNNNMADNNNNIENSKNYKNNCRFFITVKGTKLSFYKGTRIEYSLFYSHSVLEINQGVPYTASITAGEINYFKFAFDSNTKGIYITLYSSSGDTDIYINYGNNLPSFNNYIWRSTQSQMDSIFIDKNDNFFVDNKKTSLEGVYTIMLYGYTNSTYSLTVSQGQYKIIQLVPGTPSICKVDSDNKEKLCYFRVENFVNSKKVLEEDAGGLSNIIQKSIDVIDRDMHIVFNTKFIYGEGNIYAKLFKKTETEINLKDFPNEKRYDWSNEIQFHNNNNNKRNFLKIDINKNNENLSPYSMLLLSVKCADNCLFEINSATIEYDTNFKFIEVGRENLFYINSQKQPLLLSFLYKNTETMNYEFFSYTGNGEVKIFSNESYYDIENNRTNFDYIHIANFKIEKNVPYYNHFNEVNEKSKKKQNKDIREIFMEILPENSYENLGFYVKLNYENEWTKLESLGKTITYQLNSNVFNGYIDIFNEYENIILSVKSDDQKLTANVYVTINELIPFSSTNKQQKYNYPTNQSYTYTGRTNYLTSTVSIKIDTPKNYKKNYRIFYKVELSGDFSQRNINLAKTISVIVSPLMNNSQRIEANPYTIYYNSQKGKSGIKSIFDLKRIDNKDDIFVIEISSCKGQFDADLLSRINYFSDEKNKKVKFEKKYQQGRMVLTGYDLKEENYHLSIWGSDNNIDGDDNKNMNKSMSNSDDVEFLLYYFTSNNKNYVYSSIQSYINPIYLRDGKVKLEISKIKIKNIQGKISEINNMDLNYKLFISTDINDFSYMSSLCYLSKMESLPKGIKTYIKNNEIYVSGLKHETKYFINMIVRNPISGELITFTPTILDFNDRFHLSWLYLIIPIAIIIILTIIVYYYRKKYIVTKAVLNYEQKDIRNMANLPYGGESERNIASSISQASKSSTQYINIRESKI